MESYSRGEGENISLLQINGRSGTTLGTYTAIETSLTPLNIKASDIKLLKDQSLIINTNSNINLFQESSSRSPTNRSGLKNAKNIYY